MCVGRTSPEYRENYEKFLCLLPIWVQLWNEIPEYFIFQFSFFIIIEIDGEFDSANIIELCTVLSKGELMGDRAGWIRTKDKNPLTNMIPPL